MEKTTIINSDGEIRWLCDGTLHRTKGPALIDSVGSRYWFKDGVQHCELGPAVRLYDGTHEWYINGNKFTEDEFNDNVWKL